MSPFAATLLGGGIVVAALGLFAAPASAHNYPVGYSPEENSVVTEQPGVFSVTTNDLLLDLDGSGAASAMEITGPTTAGAPLYYGDGCATVSGATVETTAQLGEAGEYTVVWQTVSTDGHAVSGEFSFTWQPAAGQVLAEGSSTRPDCGGEGNRAADAPATDSGAADSSAAPAMSDVVWIGGALGAVLLAVGATVYVVRRAPRS
ncbi:copper resistance CopC family protein [Cryobacterium sp. MLB-32]|uniref:copper resistance CopC family protein n=1 Tax=Cryobacterium sp. MLB-32 TaxID=1529318 RepID=UPI00068C56A7|nr:copper resistance CopC family protein [Cryobacterium sp. MLB-32]